MKKQVHIQLNRKNAFFVIREILKGVFSEDSTRNLDFMKDLSHSFIMIF